MSQPLAWFWLEKEAYVETFKALAAREGHAFEGWGIDSSGVVEAYAVFKSKKTMDSFDKKICRLRLGGLAGFTM